MKFEWDVNKEKINLKKYKLNFKIASKVFDDPNRIEIYDEYHSTLEEARFITIGKVEDAITMVTVVYTERGVAIRIISARIATQKEVELYDSNKKH